ncbi:MAG: FixH family protein [Rhizobiaceae bacterium]
MTARAPRQFTGWHMLMVLLAFFGTIITVNLIMASYALSTWSGLVVKNSYVASQEFNGKVSDVIAQEALGWKGQLTAADGAMRFSLHTASGALVSVKGVTATFRRPVTDRQDVTLALAAAPDGGWAVRHVLADGAWIAEIDADAGGKAPWRETLRFEVMGGAIK